jgi:hypothetical protein
MSEYVAGKTGKPIPVGYIALVCRERNGLGKALRERVIA